MKLTGDLHTLYFYITGCDRAQTGPEPSTANRHQVTPTMTAARLSRRLLGEMARMAFRAWPYYRR